jgi:hypothetical protein
LSHVLFNYTYNPDQEMKRSGGIEHLKAC